MESRKHQRIKVALEVEINHPLTGRQTLPARDLSDEGVYLWYSQSPLRLGSALEVTLRCSPMIESKPTPTIKMRVSRIDEEGMVLSFINKSGAHLWRHANQEPAELRVGENLFRIFLAAIVRDANGRVLTVQQNGRWLFPGCYLQAGADWNLHLQQYLERNLSLTGCRYLRTVLTHNDPSVVARESSTMSVFQLYALENLEAGPSAAPKSVSESANKSQSTTTSTTSPYSKTRWIENTRQLDELTFSAEPLRELVREALGATADVANEEESGRGNVSAPLKPSGEDQPHKGYQHG